MPKDDLLLLKVFSQNGTKKVIIIYKELIDYFLPFSRANGE